MGDHNRTPALIRQLEILEMYFKLWNLQTIIVNYAWNYLLALFHGGLFCRGSDRNVENILMSTTENIAILQRRNSKFLP